MNHINKIKNKYFLYLRILIDDKKYHFFNKKSYKSYYESLSFYTKDSTISFEYNIFDYKLCIHIIYKNSTGEYNLSNVFSIFSSKYWLIRKLIYNIKKIKKEERIKQKYKRYDLIDTNITQILNEAPIKNTRKYKLKNLL